LFGPKVFALTRVSELFLTSLLDNCTYQLQLRDLLLSSPSKELLTSAYCLIVE